MTKRACTICGRISDGPRCPEHGGNRRAMTTTQRGYGTAHQRRRRQLLVQAIGTACPRCGEPMRADQALDLGHSVALIDDPRAVGDRIEHAACNRGAGTRRDGGGTRLDPANGTREKSDLRFGFAAGR